MISFSIDCSLRRYIDIFFLNSTKKTLNAVLLNFLFTKEKNYHVFTKILSVLEHPISILE